METINIIAENQQCIDWYIANEVWYKFRWVETTVWIHKDTTTWEVKKYLLCKIYIEWN